VCFVLTSASAPSASTAAGTVAGQEAAPAASQVQLRLGVSENRRYLVDGSGRPFFWLGDTAWRLFNGPTLDEVETYLENRRRKGFSVIQCVIAFGGPQPQGKPTDPSYPDDRIPNSEGELPWLDMNPATPNPRYFAFVDRVIASAERKGLVLAIFPAWGTFVTAGTLNLDNARQYGAWLGRRYHDRPNIVWVLGGDQRGRGFPEHRPEHEQVISLLAEGLSEGDGGTHLRTYHPNKTSSAMFHTAHWLDFNMIQSGHVVDFPSHEMVLADYHRTPIKPIVDAESRYEGMINGLAREGMRFDPHQVRKAAYGAVLSGAFGHTYGANSVWEFWRPGQWSAWGPVDDWREAIDLPGSFDMKRLRDLMLSRPWWDLEPDPTLVTNNLPDRPREHVVAARARDGSYAYVYVPERKTVALDPTRLRGKSVHASWFDPRTAAVTPIGTFPLLRQAHEGAEAPAAPVDPRRADLPPAAGSSATATARFTAPTGQGGPDYVLILEAVQ